MERTAKDVWNECLGLIRDNVNRQSFKTWFEPIEPLSVQRQNGEIKLTVQLPSQFYYEWLEEHYYTLIRRTLSKVLGTNSRLYYEIVLDNRNPEEGAMTLPANKPQNRSPQPPPQSRPPIAEDLTPSLPIGPDLSTSGPTGGMPASPYAVPGIKPQAVDPVLNNGYTFDRFIEGDGNRLARSAAWAIAQQPGSTSFNPFLVYGGSGLGKTHLIQAIGNYAHTKGTAQNICYVSSEEFTSQFIQSIQKHRTHEFSAFYRNIDVFIVDDVQFFGGKEKTQEEFFHVFNALHQSGKQIVLSADRPPREIVGIEERLLSRFQWGLQVDIKPPDLETRIAILRHKAEEDGVELPDEVIEFVAGNFRSNIRELEGSLIRLLANATLRQQDITLDLAREVLKDLIRRPQVELTIGEIQRVVSEYLNVPEDLIRARTRKREVAQARQISMYFCKKLTKHSLKTIGLHFGGRDHSTVIHAIQTVENMNETDKDFAERLTALSQKLAYAG